MWIENYDKPELKRQGKVVHGTCSVMGWGSKVMAGAGRGASPEETGACSEDSGQPRELWVERL